MTTFISYNPYIRIPSWDTRQYPYPGYFGFSQTYVYNPSMHAGQTVFYPFGNVLTGPILGDFGIGHTGVPFMGAHGFTGSFGGYRM
ncbi:MULTISPECIES: hypothetical protein [Bacillus]|nr:MULTISPECIES: hypothetical protein [Bacillus]